jgi:hypothetical protein
VTTSMHSKAKALECWRGITARALHVRALEMDPFGPACLVTRMTRAR